VILLSLNDHLKHNNFGVEKGKNLALHIKKILLYVKYLTLYAAFPKTKYFLLAIFVV